MFKTTELGRGAEVDEGPSSAVHMFSRQTALQRPSGKMVSSVVQRREGRVGQTANFVDRWTPGPCDRAKERKKLFGREEY